jgi:hypothetical protein
MVDKTYNIKMNLTSIHGRQEFTYIVFEVQ